MRPPKAKAHRKNKAKPGRPRSAIVFINRLSGTVRSRGEMMVRSLIEQYLNPVFEDLTIIFVDGGMLAVARQALKKRSYDTVIAGGGDGSVNSIAALLMDSEIVLGVLPLGTMNIIAKALGFSPVLEQALAQFAMARIVDADVAMAGNRLVLHQISFGIQPRMVRLRERLGYRSRWTKMLASVRAMSMVLLQARAYRIKLEIDKQSHQVDTPLLIIINHALPYECPHGVDVGGGLGLYVLRDSRMLQMVRLAFDYLAQRLDRNPALDLQAAEEVRLVERRRPSSRRSTPRKVLASIDGELVKLPLPLVITMRRKTLRLLMASPAEHEAGG